MSDQNKRKDKAKKALSHLKNDFSFVHFQDENIRGWQSSLFGRVISNSSLGYVKQGLKDYPCAQMMNRYFPSTQMCLLCGALTKHKLDKIDYDCTHCGFHYNDRDIKAAQTILIEGQNKRFETLNKVLLSGQELIMDNTTPLRGAPKGALSSQSEARLKINACGESSPCIDNTCIVLEKLESVKQEANSFRSR